MPRYFFDTRDNDNFTPDPEGLELPDLAAARTEVARALAEMAREVIPGSEHRTLSIEVCGDDGPIFASRLIFEMSSSTATEDG